MNTLIFNGSPRKNGDTVSLINETAMHLEGSFKTVDAYYCNISPCIDCRYCMKNYDCCINDGMKELYSYIKTCDNILIASPVHFSQLTGQLLSVCSRLQAFYCSKVFGGIDPVPKKKRGGIILVGGGDGSPDSAGKTAVILLKLMGAERIHPIVCYHNTDSVPAHKDGSVLMQVKSLADFFNEQNG